MNGRKFASMGMAVLIACMFGAVPVWANVDDPWAPDMKGKQLPQQSTIKVVPVQPEVEDTGDPWFVDTRENDRTIMKPVTSFKLTPVQPEVEDTGYPWFADTKENGQTNMQSVQ